MLSISGGSNGGMETLDFVDYIEHLQMCLPLGPNFGLKIAGWDNIFCVLIPALVCPLKLLFPRWAKFDVTKVN